MTSELDEAQVPTVFPFPFPPYDIQDSFMRALFLTLERGQFGIFESPTGTGKSLSLICGALAWFVERERKRLEELETKIKEKSEVDDAGDDWLGAVAKRIEKDEERRKAVVELKMLKDKDERMQELRRRRKSVAARTNRDNNDDIDDILRDTKELVKLVAKQQNQMGEFDEQDEEIIVDDYTSDGDDDEEDTKTFGENTVDDKIEDYSLRIFYCSRTHSQLSQFVKEIQKSPFAENVRLVSLASRNNMCVNESVTKLGNGSLINEKCLDMQKKGGKAKPVAAEGKRKSSSSSCPFRKQATVNQLSDQALLQVMDLEQLVTVGRRIKGCPYYASRQAVPDAQIVVLPYNTLLHKPTRDVIGINLRNSVVIIDEAHNLLDTLSHIHSVEVGGQLLCKIHSQVQQYFDRYNKRLKAKNILYLQQLLYIVANLIRLLGHSAKSEESRTNNGTAQSRLVKPEVLMIEADIFTINIFKIIKYIQKSKIAQKLNGFTEKYSGGNVLLKTKEEAKGVSAFLKSLNKKPSEVRETPKDEVTVENKPSTGCPLLIFLEFLQALVNVSSGEARILISIQATLGQSAIKYCLLNPSFQFTELVRECRSIIVAGGTMQPISEFRDRLFVSAGASPDRVTHFSCGHVIPKENIMPLVISSGPTGRLLDFSYNCRDAPDMMDELSRVLLNMANIIPNGIVCFFPSYDYEKKINDYWQGVGLLKKIGTKKRIFREPKRSSDLDKVLQDYCKAAKTSSGAILFSVVGGKMSEGINFSDELGRCVIMVGLPFPNAHSLELKEKMAYLTKSDIGKPKEDAGGRTAGQVHYENLCMKAVNQSIGRAIRHKGDYAAILLLDHRYKRQNIKSQLPQWIEQHVVVAEKFPQAVPLISRFFKGRNGGSS